LKINQKKGLLGYKRPHRPGHVFPYLDDEPFSYPHLDKYIRVLRKDFGSKVRITTVGYSRKNKKLDRMHNRISNNLCDGVAALRISVTPYTLMWRKSDRNNLPENEFAKDLAHTLSKYISYKQDMDFGKNKFSIEMRKNHSYKDLKMDLRI